MDKHLEQSLANILQKHFMVKRPFIRPYKKINKDLGLTPLEFIEMLTYVEDEFNVALNDHEISHIHTVSDLVYAVQRHVVR